MSLSRRTRGLLSFGVAALVAASLSAVVDPAAATPTVRTGTASEPTYAVTEPICARPKDPAAMRCLGLKRVEVPRGTRGAFRMASSARSAAGAGPSHGYTPKQLATAYGYNPKLSRKNLTVGIVLWHDAPRVLSDLNHFNKKYKIKPNGKSTKETSTTFRKVNERGRTSPLPKRDRGAAGEIALDTQAVRAVCNTCRILLVEADGPYDTDLANAVNTAVRLGADIVTNSYGTPERRFSGRVQKAYRHPGVAIVASTGDSGWFGWDLANDPRYVSDNAPMFPSTSPSVIAVGGTSLTLNSRNHRVKETVWNSNGPADSRGSTREEPQGASGGGCSKRFTAPLWQRRTPGYAAAGCNGKRLAADTAMVADPATGFDVYDTYGSGGWVTVGGTSLSSPLAAGMLALAGGPRGSRYPASALYGNASARGWTRYDVTAGGNGFCHTATTGACSAALQGTGTTNPNKLDWGLTDCSYSRAGGETIPLHRSSECNAVAGFDGPTGVGTPRSASIFLRTDPYLAVNWRGSVTHRRAETFRVGVRTPISGTRITSLSYTWGDGKRTVTTSRSAKHTYRKAGRFTVSITSQDSRGQTATVSRRLTVR